uniref:Peptidase C19 ubiquitin carboxyl-terminal hydrolase domain-containing protein n=1 Tax=Eutreptiella gymnastica TaxID=73025 RepID=A0A7S4G198_9EUGL
MVGEGDFEDRLRGHFESEARTCEHCLKASPPKTSDLLVEKYLCTTPPIFAFVVAWVEDCASKEHLSDIADGLAPQIRLNKVYRAVGAGQKQKPTPYQIVGMICFYGRHYTSFFYNQQLQKWVFIDDSSVRPVGDWSDVKQNMIDGRHMPLVLFYSQKSPVR